MKPLICLAAIVFCLLVQPGCKSLPDNPPISQAKMASILMDLQVAETYSLGLGDSVKNKFEKNYDSLAVFYTSILKHYKVSYEEFEDAMDWYKARPLMIDSLYNRVITQIAETKVTEQIKEVASPDAKPVADNTKDSLKSTVDSLAARKKNSPAAKAKKDTSGNPNKREF